MKTLKRAEETNQRVRGDLLKIAAFFVLVTFSMPQLSQAEESSSVLPPGPLDRIRRPEQPAIDPPSPERIFKKPVPESTLQQWNKTTLQFFLEGDHSIFPAEKVMVKVKTTVSSPKLETPIPVKRKPSPLAGFILQATFVQKEKKEDKKEGQKDSNNHGKKADEKSPHDFGPGITTGNLKDIIAEDLKPLVDPRIEWREREPLDGQGMPPAEVVSRDNLGPHVEGNHFVRNAVTSPPSSEATLKKRKAERGKRGGEIRRRHYSRYRAS